MVPCYMNISLEEKIRKEAYSLYPVPFSVAQINSFINRSKKTKKEDFLVELSWIKLKSDHMKSWRKRYGLDDRLPHKMIDGKLALTCTWHCSENSLSYTLKLDGQSPVKGIIPGSINHTKVKLKKLLISQNEKYSLLYNDFLLIGKSGEVFNFECPKPSFDWDLWKQNILPKLNINKSTLSKLVNNFVSIDCTNWNTLEDFENYLLSNSGIG